MMELSTVSKVLNENDALTSTPLSNKLQSYFIDSSTKSWFDNFTQPSVEGQPTIDISPSSSVSFKLATEVLTDSLKVIDYSLYPQKSP